MRTSDTIDALAKDLAKAHHHLKNAVKSAENPHFKSKYADLAAIRDVTAPILSNHNMAIVQTTDMNEEGRFQLITRLVHTSGQWIEAVFPLPFIPDKPQIMGSAITYARRYSWSAICGIAAGLDDDAEATRSYEGNGRGIDSAWSKKSMDPLSEPGGPSARSSKGVLEPLDAERKKQTTLRAMVNWWNTTSAERAKLSTGFRRRLTIDFLAQSCRTATSAEEFVRFWNAFSAQLEDIRQADEHEAAVLDDAYQVTLDTFNLTEAK